MKNFSWRLIIILGVLITAVVYVLPTIKPGLWPHKKINLGLDLQGGMHLVLEVDSEKAVESTVERTTQEMRTLVRKNRIPHSGPDQVEGTKISLSVTEKEAVGKFEALLDDEFRGLRLVSKSQGNNGGMTFLMDLPGEEVERIKKSAVDQALETIRNRIDQFGVSEPDIRRQGEQRILIQLPGIKDPARAKKLIGKTALLEFKLVDETNSVSQAQEGNVPPGSELLYEVDEDPETGRITKTPMLIKKRALLTGANLSEAKIDFDQYNNPTVSIRFNKKGARDFERITGENVNKRLAIILDNSIYSAPNIQEKIAGGDAQITGNFTLAQANDLALVLRAGSLPAPVEILEERTVGPSLGSDSIKKGLMSMAIGGLIVILFMMVYYKLSGIIADFALLLNIGLIAGGLAAFQATLTLPGIAGIILTIGMAVDANVLIFERIREEMALGKSPRSALDAGYDRATLTILDANVTTLIAALVLFQFGTGPVKGFAVTLSLGVLASLFTSLVLTRSIFSFLLINRKMKTLSI